MPNFAVHNGSTILNVIVADTAAHAEELTGLAAFETSGQPWIDWIFVDGEWLPPRILPSWVWDGDDWVPPIPRPTEGGPWRWDEDTVSWVEEVTE